MDRVLIKHLSNKMLKVVYLSSSDIGREMFNWLSKENCEIVYHNLDGEKIDETKLPYFDIGLLFLYPYKIKNIEHSKKWINFHPGPLPELKGRNVAYRAIIEDFMFFGATTHYITSEFDDGNIIYSNKFKISTTDTAGDLIKKSKNLLKEHFKKVIHNFIKNNIFVLPSVEQEKTNYVYKNKIDDFITLDDDIIKKIRALSVEGLFYPKIRIGDDIYKIIKEY
jgi:methionyl-tRNA formyltransferase